MERFRVNRYLHLAVYAAVCLLTLSCDQSFEPIEPSELQFSVFGYLDASADTQWIRLMPIRSTVITSQAALDVAVQLENLSSGHVIVMRDSVFQFTQHNDDVGSDGHFLHNFWTNQEIAPGSSFRFEARGGDGVPSVGEITVPPDYRVELWLWQPQPRSAESDRIRLLGLRHVAFVTLITEGRDACGPWTEYRHFPVPENDSDTHVIPVNRGVSRLACPPSVIDRQDLRVVGSSAPWPKGDGFETGGLGVTDAPSNVSHAVGFLGGVLTKRLPYDSCTLAGAGTETEFCVLTYDDFAARIEGRVVDGDCLGRPVGGATVRLTEQVEGLGTTLTIRTATTDSTGSYSMHAFRPNIGHAVSITHDARVPEMNNILLYEAHTDTIEFGPGERRVYDASLRRRAPC